MQLSRIEGEATERSVKLTKPAGASPTVQLVPEQGCVHGRMIDEVRTKGGKRTGKVRCLECQAIIDDPYQGVK
ncbi:MAG: hypothetical protein AB7P24_05890 [Nitrospira sp.]